MLVGQRGGGIRGWLLMVASETDLDIGDFKRGVLL